MRRSVHALAAALACVAVLAGCGDTTVERGTVVGEVGAGLDEYITRAVPFGFSGALLVARDGEIIVNKGYGLANRADGVPNTSETVFTTGSITKQFTAAAIMRLEMQGKLDTSHAIGDYLDGVPPDKEGLTIHHLLTHTAGVIESTGPDYVEAGRDETVRKILDAPLGFEPGTEFSYSNAGYSLLAAIVELVSERPYEEFLRDELWQPAGMRHTGYRLPRWGGREVAHWYVGETDNGVPLDKIYPSWNLLGNGGVLSTTGDMYRWYEALVDAEILSPAAKQKLLTPFLNEYAYGWDVVQHERGMLVQHDGGSTLGSSAEFRWFLAEDVLIVLFCNQAYGGQPLFGAVRDKIEALAFEEHVELPPETADPVTDDLERYTGNYRLKSGGRYAVVHEEGRLVLKTLAQDAINLLFFPGADPPDRFNDLNVRSNALIAAAVRGDVAPFEREFGERGERALGMITGEIARFEEESGTAARASVSLGTVPSPFGPMLLSGLRIKNETGGERAMSIVWQDGRVIGLDELAFEVAIPLARVSENEFVGYHLVFGRNHRVGFELADDGDVTALVVRDGEEGVVATRLHSHDHDHAEH